MRVFFATIDWSKTRPSQNSLLVLSCIMRIATFTLAIGQIAFLALLMITSGGSDAAGNAMSSAFIDLAVLFTALFLVPAVVLASIKKAPRLALGLAIASAFLLAFGLAAIS